MGDAIKLISTVALVLLLGGQLYAQTASPNPIAVEHPWARATPKGATTGAVYMTVTNNATSADYLVGATTPLSDKIQFHTETEDNGVSRMRQVDTIDLPPGAKIVNRRSNLTLDRRPILALTQFWCNSFIQHRSAWLEADRYCRGRTFGAVRA